MNAAKHTPGPWRVGRRGSVVADVAVPEMNGSDAVDYYGGHMVAESVVDKNAPVIAAAPELLQLVQELIDMEGPQPGTAAWADKARALVAKVTGSAA